MVNYTRRDGTTYAGILLSRNSTKSGRYMILVYDVTPGVRCSGACYILKSFKSRLLDNNV